MVLTQEDEPGRGRPVGGFGQGWTETPPDASESSGSETSMRGTGVRPRKKRRKGARTPIMVPSVLDQRSPTVVKCLQVILLVTTRIFA